MNPQLTDPIDGARRAARQRHKGRGHGRLALALLCAVTLTTLPGRPSPASEPAHAQSDAHFVWVEGEDAVRSSFNGHGWYSSAGLRMDLLSPGVPGGRAGGWLAHYSNQPAPAEAEYHVEVPATGTYAFWLRASAFQTRMWVAVDGDPRQEIDLDSDPREYLRLNDPTGPNPIDIRFISWFRLPDLDLTQGTHRLVFGVEPRRNGGSETHGGIDAIALTDFPWGPSGAMRPAPDAAEPAADAWFPLIPSDDPYAPESVTDASHLLHKPAGSKGHLRRVEDRIETADGTPIKLWGVNAAIGDSPEVMQAQARYYAKNGVNLVRLHPVLSEVGLLEFQGRGEGQLDEARLDRLDRWFHTLKEAGIYMQWSLFYPHVITESDGYPSALYDELPDAPTWNLPPGTTGKSTSGYVNFMPQLQEAERVWLQALMDHVNPYTGLRYADDPALAIVEVHNEDSIFWHFPLNTLEGGQETPLHTAELKRMWMEWLQGEYASDAELRAAWGPAGRGSKSDDSLNNPNMTIYGAWEMAADGPERNKAETARMGDFIRFLAEGQRDYFERRGEELRAMGFQGVTVSTAWMAGGPAARLANLWTDDALDMIDRHRYFGGHAAEGQSTHRIAAGPVRDGSHLSQPGTGILSAAFEQIEDKPFMLSEWAQSPPNRWKAEIAPLYAFYGIGLNGWDASTNFAASLPRIGGGWPADMASYASDTPHYMGQFPALARAIHQGHIQEGEAAAARRITARQDIFNGVDGFDRVSNWSDGGGGNLNVPSEVFAIGRVSTRLEPLGREIPRSERMNWSAYWNQQTGRIRSSTDELTWDTQQRLITVESERTQGIIGFAGGLGEISLPALSATVDTPFVSLLFTSLDERPLSTSEHILITAMARDRQTGARYREEGGNVVLEEFGGPPLLLEPVQARITFSSDIASARALDIHGEPVGGSLDVDGGRSIRIDGRHRSYLYEVKRAPVDPLPVTPSPRPSPTPPATGEPPSPGPEPSSTPLEPTPSTAPGERDEIYLPMLAAQT